MIDLSIRQYCEQYTSTPPPYLKRIERETHLKTIAPQMLSGPLQGRLLSLLSKLVRPRYILEIGTFTGYSALCLAEGLEKSGSLHTIEINPEYESMIRSNWAMSPFVEQMHLHLGAALEIIPRLNSGIDLVFIDAAKEQYPHYYDLVIEKLQSGGLIIADNILWGGKVLTPAQDKETQAIMSFSEKVKADERVEVVLLPIRDGISLIRKL